jgi:hypothetical protein
MYVDRDKYLLRRLFMKVTTRRSFFNYMALLGLVTFSATPLHAKAVKEAFKYQDTPKDDQSCKDCIHFIAKSNECKLIEGPISPEGWCTLYNPI